MFNQGSFYFSVVPLCLCIAVIAYAAPLAPAVRSQGLKVPVPLSGAYLGANTDPDEGLEAGFIKLELILNKQMAIHHEQFSDAFEIVDLGRQSDPFEIIHANHNVTPMISVHIVDRTLAEIASNHINPADRRQSGTISPNTPPDEFYRRLADSFRAYGKPIFFRWNAEMNQPWNSYCSNGVFNPFRKFNCKDPDDGKQQKPEDFVAAWKHIHAIFDAEGAFNVSWIWCPAADATSKYTPDIDQLRSLYPGDRFVDWTCIDGYNWSPPNRWRSFKDVFQPYYQALLQIAPGIPIMIGEFNTNVGDDRFGSMKADWLADAYSAAPSLPMIKALVLFNVYDHENSTDWRIQNFPAASLAVKQSIANDYFISSTGEIPRPIAHPKDK